MLVTGVRPSWSVVSPEHKQGSVQKRSWVLSPQESAAGGGEWSPGPWQPQELLKQHRRRLVCAPLPMPIQALAPQLHLGISRGFCFPIEDSRPSLHWELFGSLLAGEGCVGPLLPIAGPSALLCEEGNKAAACILGPLLLKAAQQWLMLSLAAGPLSGSLVQAPVGHLLVPFPCGEGRWLPSYGVCGEQQPLWLPRGLLLGSLHLHLGKHLCFLPLLLLSVAVLANKTPVHHQPHQEQGHGEGLQRLNIDFPSPWEHEMAQAAVSISVSSWHRRLYQSISNYSSSPGLKEIQI